MELVILSPASPGGGRIDEPRRAKNEQTRARNRKSKRRELDTEDQKSRQKTDKLQRSGTARPNQLHKRGAEAGWERERGKT